MDFPMPTSAPEGTGPLCPFKGGKFSTFKRRKKPHDVAAGLTPGEEKANAPRNPECSHWETAKRGPVKTHETFLPD